MIVICPKAFAGADCEFERMFLRYYLIKIKEKAYVANEVWDAWRFRILQATQKQELITNQRGLFRPEDIRKDPITFKELEPKDYSNEQLIESTKSLIRRNWADIIFFITNDYETYRDVECISKIECLSLTEFIIKIQSNPSNRQLLNDFNVYYSDIKDGK